VGRGGRRYLPYVFTEHGALMVATVLNSKKAVQMSIYLVRAFVQMREAILENASILKRLAEIDHRLIEHDSVLREIVDRLQPLLDAPAVDEDAKPKIGFHPGNR
jgi:phage regulator Rha-like protein